MFIRRGGSGDVGDGEDRAIPAAMPYASTVAEVDETRPEAGAAVEGMATMSLLAENPTGRTLPHRRTLATARSRARLPDRAPTRRGDAAVKGIRILGTNRSTIRPADDVAVWARTSTTVTEN